MEPTLATRDETKVIGLAVRTTNREEMDPRTARIGGLWERFFREDVAAKVPNRRPGGAVVAVYTDYESDHTGPYTLIAGVEVTSLESIPEGMTGVTIPAGRYWVFAARGPVPAAIIAAWGVIWSWFQTADGEARAYTVDCEVYGDDGADIFIAIR